jgi:hypothetical protein
VGLLSIDRDPGPRLLRQFSGIWFPAACALLGWALFRKTGSWPWAVAGWAPAAALSVAGLVRPSLMKPVWIAWMTAVFPIGWAVSHAVLLGTYYLVLTPVGLVLRLTGRDPMTRTLDRRASTYWRAHRPAGDAARYFRQF